MPCFSIQNDFASDIYVCDEFDMGFAAISIGLVAVVGVTADALTTGGLFTLSGVGAGMTAGAAQGVVAEGAVEVAKGLAEVGAGMVAGKALENDWKDGGSIWYDLNNSSSDAAAFKNLKETKRIEPGKSYNHSSFGITTRKVLILCPDGSIKHNICWHKNKYQIS